MKYLKNSIVILLIIILTIFIAFKIYSIITAGTELKKVTSNNENNAEDLIDKWEELYEKSPEFIEGLSGSNGFGLVIESAKADMDNYWYYVNGVVVNNSQNDYEEVLIQYDAFDANGYKLVTCSDIAYDLKSGEKYSFKATCVTDMSKIHSYKLYNLAPLKSY